MLLHSVHYDDVYQAAIEMQRIFTYECPIIVCYENMLLNAYRNDRFEGHVTSALQGVTNWWTNFKVNLKDVFGGPYGGTFRISNSLDMDTFNFMVSSSENTKNVLDNLYDSLLRRAPDGTDIFWLADSYVVETHDDNPGVPDGYTRFTFQMTPNVTWTDGHTLTADDVARQRVGQHSRERHYYITLCYAKRK